MFSLHNGNCDSEEGNGSLFRSPDHSYKFFMPHKIKNGIPALSN